MGQPWPPPSFSRLPRFELGSPGLELRVGHHVNYTTTTALDFTSLRVKNERDKVIDSFSSLSHTHTHTHAHSHTHAHAHARTHSHALYLTHTHKLAHALSLSLIYTLLHPCTYTHTHTHTLSLSLMPNQKGKACFFPGFVRLSKQLLIRLGLLWLHIMLLRQVR